jgi:hypothetical protein
MRKLEKRLIDAINSGVGYDFISSHYNEFDKEQLRDIIIELFYEIETAHTPNFKSVIDELKCRWS